MGIRAIARALVHLPMWAGNEPGTRSCALRPTARAPFLAAEAGVGREERARPGERAITPPSRCVDRKGIGLKNKWLPLTLGLVSSLVLVAPAGAQQQAPSRNVVRGSFSLSVHTHSSQFGGPSGPGTLFETDPLPFRPGRSDFSYSAIPCNRPAPFNDQALVFQPGYPGLASPAAVRHFVQGTLTPTTRSGDRGIVRGNITTILCLDGMLQEDRIFLTFHGRYTRTSDNEVVLTGTFRIAGGTGRFADLSGGGSMEGQFTCLPPILQRERATNCADLGVFSDSVIRLRGSFLDTTFPAV